MMHHITTTWQGGMAFESNNPSGLSFKIDASAEDGGEGKGLRPKALMLSALAGCSGLDVAQIIRKMRLQLKDFKIDIRANLSDSDPKIYESVTVEYHFYGEQLDAVKLQRAVDLSVEKYCGVMEMFRRFSKLETRAFFHET